ncbi:hypothetical protein [uncultured Sneathiella sp.]|uniref:hypothetical protein n=1 Tax=uncultured Sneathiella sp. TaxID=879315 RepID=UPI0030DDAE37
MFEVLFAFSLIPIVYLFFLMTGSNWFLSILPVFFVFVVYVASNSAANYFVKYKPLMFIIIFVVLSVSGLALAAHSMTLTKRFSGVEIYESGTLTYQGLLHQVIAFGAIALAIVVFKKICLRISVRR